MPILDYVPRLVEANRAHRVAAPAGTDLAAKSRFWTPGTVVTDQGREGACFPPGTFVRMADGSQKAVEDVRTPPRYGVNGSAYIRASDLNEILFRAGGEAAVAIERKLS